VKNIARKREADSIGRSMETIADIRKMPELGKGDIHIWGVHLPDVLDRLELLRGLLSNAEREKAARFHREVDRNSSIAARGALRILLSGYTGIPADGIQFHYSKNGKPHIVPPAASRLPAESVPQAARPLTAEQQGRRAGGGTKIGRQDGGDTVSFNVSHSGDWVVLAFGRNRNIGVDVEKIKREMDVLPIAKRYFTPEERVLVENAEDRHAVFFELWARKEAYVKACGSTLFTELSSFPVPMEEVGKKDGWYFRRLEAGSQYAAAVVTDKVLTDVPCYDFGGLKWES